MACLVQIPSVKTNNLSVSFNSSVSLESVFERSWYARVGPLSTEDKRMSYFSVALVNMPEKVWFHVVLLGMLLIVMFLSRLNLEEKNEDLTVYQALPIAVLWSALGIGLIIFNKIIFLPAGAGFDFPFTILIIWMQALMCTVFTNLLRFARPSMLPAVSERKLSMKSYFINIFPIAGLQAAALALGNCAYVHISVAYIQMVKNTAAAFVFFFSIAFGLETSTIPTTVSVIMVVLGLLLTTAGEFEFSMLGFMFQMGATLAESLRLALTKIVLSSDYAVKLDPVSALFYASPTVMLLVTTPMILVDLRRLTWVKLWSMRYVLFANALLAFGLNVTSMFFMKRCGATTYALTGVLKDVALIFLCCVFFGHPMTHLQLVGFLISLVGFQLYSQLKTDSDYVMKLWWRLRGLDADPCKGEDAPLLKAPSHQAERSPRADPNQKLSGAGATSE